MSSQYSCGLEVKNYRWICKWQSIDVFILCRSLCISMPSYVFYINLCLALCQTNHSILFCLLCMDSFAHSTRQRKCIWRIWVDYEVFFVYELRTESRLKLLFILNFVQKQGENIIVCYLNILLYIVTFPLLNIL